MGEIDTLENRVARIETKITTIAEDVAYIKGKSKGIGSLLTTLISLSAIALAVMALITK